MDNWQKLNARFHLLEAALWVTFAYFVVQAADRYDSDSVTLVGVIALAAIGVRATRAEVPEGPKDSGDRSE